jgi:hypothetical protein
MRMMISEKPLQMISVLLILIQVFPWPLVFLQNCTSLRHPATSKARQGALIFAQIFGGVEAILTSGST